MEDDVKTRKRSNPAQKKSPLKNRGVQIGVVLVVIIFIAVSVYAFYPRTPTDNTPTPTGNPIAVISTTMGTIKVELYADEMPITTANFVKLVNDGFYNGMIFHRVMEGFMIQAGYMFPDGTTEESPYGSIEYEDNADVTHVDGAISMASTADRVGGSSQFFICDGAQHGLDGRYAAFGKTIEGQDVVTAISHVPRDNSYGSVGGGKPTTDVIINSITITYE